MLKFSLSKKQSSLKISKGSPDPDKSCSRRFHKGIPHNERCTKSFHNFRTKLYLIKVKKKSLDEERVQSHQPCCVIFFRDIRHHPKKPGSKMQLFIQKRCPQVFPTGFYGCLKLGGRTSGTHRPAKSSNLRVSQPTLQLPGTVRGAVWVPR